MFLHNNKKLFIDILGACHNDTGISISIIEKDYYVCLLLEKIVEKCPGVVFKGGTSLSKCYKVINRFSEDLDLGLNIDKASQGMRRNLKYHIIEAIKELDLVLENKDNIYSRTYFNRYQINYSLLEESLLLKSYLYVETALFIKPFPYEVRKVESYIYSFLKKMKHEELMGSYNIHSFEVKVQTIARTFIDKLFAVGDYYLSRKVFGHSRHLYDLYKLYPYISFNKDFYRLFCDVKEIRSQDSECLSAHMNQDIKRILLDIYDKDYFKKDYEDITTKLLFEDVPYKTVKDNLVNIINKL